MTTSLDGPRLALWSPEPEPFGGASSWKGEDMLRDSLGELQVAAEQRLIRFGRRWLQRPLDRILEPYRSWRGIRLINKDLCCPYFHGSHGCYRRASHLKRMNWCRCSCGHRFYHEDGFTIT